MANSRFIREDGKAAVIVSHGFGSGFSSWHDRDMAVDGRIVRWLYDNCSVLSDERDEDEDYIRVYDDQIDDFKDFLSSIGYKDVSLYCLRNELTIYYLPVGTVFRINEYDGAESIEILNIKSYIVL